MRRKTVLLVVGVLVAAVVAVPLLRLTGRVSLHEFAVESLEDIALPELLQRLRDFHRVVTRDGLKVLEISAKEASFFRDTSAVTIVAPKVLFFDKGEQVGEISGGRGNIIIDDGNLSSVEVTGGVRIAFVRFEITAEDVAYDREAQVVTTRGPATMRSDEFEVRGVGMTVDLGEQVLRVPSGVRMEVYRTGTRTQWRSKRES